MEEGVGRRSARSELSSVIIRLSYMKPAELFSVWAMEGESAGQVGRQNKVLQVALINDSKRVLRFNLSRKLCMRHNS